MKYPEKLLEKVRQRSQGMQLEGINEGAGPVNPVLMLVGEAPGRNEIKTNIPFNGNSGKELMKSLALLKLKREDVYITSVVRSRPYSKKKVFDKKLNTKIVKYPNRKPTKKEILAHAPLFDYEVEQVKPKIIVAMGSTAVERLLGSEYKISTDHGKVLENQAILQLNQKEDGYEWSKDKYTIFLEYHPAAVLYRRKLQETIEQDWLKIGHYLKDSK
ncbi:uracil-DNA glycosylase [Lactobacillus sp. PV037]|uniref:uracil-DNA glycosylase n=1 Tax=Lactobacillus sp. PV037 TaxID=2594496 RepID=UPI002240819A|nr:uracil-DNA glycosylase [Lactobacillus sp. PV037]QNQ83571.1 uracil-DNA glycosylase [Lactobacillus sp. PV037]